MLNRSTLKPLLALVLLMQLVSPLFGQLGFKINIPKPKEYEDRQLRSERTPEGKLRFPGKLLQNTVTHFNFTYNATHTLNEVIRRAKAEFRDDYSKLLPFYNYTLDATLRDSLFLDTIIQKASSGIALHDLRNDWVDNLYLLWGAAFHFQKKFDSAHQIFQFINYSFAPREKDGYYKTIGSARDGNQVTSIVSPEKKGLGTAFGEIPPSRNDAFVWQIRNYLAEDKFAEASALIEVLRNDPNLPHRLQRELEEVRSLYFYKQARWDSAAAHLALALDNAPSQQEKARWEYLTAQLYEHHGNYLEAKKFYLKTIPHTSDLILEIYARLGAVRSNKISGVADIERNVTALYQMGEREKYVEYQDIIYYMAAQMDLSGNNQDRALRSLLLSTQASSHSVSQRNKAFLQLAELLYTKGNYEQSYRYYDSIKLTDKFLQDPRGIQDRKKALSLLVSNMQIVQRQDSLQRIAALPEVERKEFVRKVLRQLRKQEGVGSQLVSSPVFPNTPPSQNLFTSSSEKGEWYFYNAASRNRGLGEFKSKWGNRPNTDHWRRLSSLQGGIRPGQVSPTDTSSNQSAKSTGTEPDFDSLYDNLPLSEEKKKNSDDSLSNALLQAGKIMIQDVEDCEAGTALLEKLRSRFVAFDKMEEVYFNLFLCYQRLGPPQRAAEIQQLMTQKFPNGSLTKVSLGKTDPTNKKQNTAADSLYTAIYSSFQQGDYPSAIAGKKLADSLYADSKWTAQLIFMEAVWHCKERRDSTAIRLLREIGIRYPASPLSQKANKLIETMANREMLEKELENYKALPIINRP